MLNYRTLSQQEYGDLLVSFISSQEGHLDHATARPAPDHTTIGYGYTFFRNNNLALWQAAGITLTSSEIQQLQDIDAASNNQKDNLALQFTRTITQSEAIALLRHTYPEYEGPAKTLGMPFSEERAAFVSITYNRGEGNVNSKMQDFFSAIQKRGKRGQATLFGVRGGGRVGAMSIRGQTPLPTGQSKEAHRRGLAGSRKCGGPRVPVQRVVLRATGSSLWACPRGTD